MIFSVSFLGVLICAFDLVLPKVAAMDQQSWTVNPLNIWAPQRCNNCGGLCYAPGWEGRGKSERWSSQLQCHRWDAQRKRGQSATDDWKIAQSVYDFTVDDIHGNPVSLSKYKGHVLLIVNVASKCGLTANNYRELVELHNRYHDSKGLRILAFPCNQFGGQEPGTNEEIVCFAKSKNALFDFFDKIKVNGEDAHPLWKYLKKEQGGTLGDMIKWNFTKFIVDKNGRVVERHGPTTDPLKLISSLEKYF